MKITATTTKIETVEVEVSPKTVADNLREFWLKGLNKTADYYINHKGEWETWDDCGGQGSGFYEQHGKASKQEKEVLKAFNLIKGEF